MDAKQTLFQLLLDVMALWWEVVVMEKYGEGHSDGHVE